MSLHIVFKHLTISQNNFDNSGIWVMDGGWGAQCTIILFSMFLKFFVVFLACFEISI